MSQKKEMLYEGKAKQVFATDNPDEVVVRFKDDATAFNAQKKGQVDLKGEMNNAITTLIFEYLNQKGSKPISSKIRRKRAISKKFLLSLWRWW